MESKTPQDYHISQPKPRPSSSDLWFFSYLPWSLYNGLSTPLIPLLALILYRDDSPLIVAAVVAASTLTEVPFTIFWGNISDRIRHRKWFVVASFVATGLVLLVMPFAPNIQDYLILNVVEGVCSSASTPIGTMLLLETRNKSWWPRDVGTFGLVSGIGTMIGLGLGAAWLFFLTGTGSLSLPVIPAMQALLFLTGVLAILSGILAARWIEEPKEHIDRNSLDDDLRSNAGLVERVRGFRRRVLNVVDLAKGEPSPMPKVEIVFLAALFIVMVGSQTFYGTFVYFLSAPAGGSLPQYTIFIVFLSSAAASTALFYHSGVVVEKYSPKRVFIASVLGRAALVPLFLYCGFIFASDTFLETWTIIALNGVMGALWAFASTASTIFLLDLLTRNENRGKALGLYNAVAGFGGLIGTIFGGWLYSSFNVMTAYGVAALVTLLGGLMLFPIVLRMTPFRHRGLPVKKANAPKVAVKEVLKPWQTRSSGD